MPFKLVVKASIEDAETEEAEFKCEQDIVRIGRQTDNEVVLSDFKRRVGRQHAQIQQKEGQYLLVDIGSKNGTKLNDNPIEVGKEYPLTKNDILTIGPFSIAFHPNDPVPIIDTTMEPDGDATVISFLPDETLSDLFYDLRSAYVEERESRVEKRISTLVDILKKGLDQSNEPDKTLNAVEAHFIEPAYQEEKIKQQDKAAVYTPPVDYAINVGIQKIAGDQIKTDVPTTRILDRTGQILAMTFDFLETAIKGRHALQSEIGADATRIFAGRQNVIKIAEGSEQIRSLLFNFNQQEERILSDLKEVFQDIAIHPIGLIAGFKEGLRGLLRELDPISFKRKAQREPFCVGPIPMTFPPFSVLSAWRHYQTKHAELSTEEVRTFEKFWGKYIAKGYLDLLQRKKSS